MRQIKKVIVHCTASQDSLDIGFKDINAWHKERGFLSPSGIHCGYHYIIKRDGTVQRGRPDSEVGAHCKGQNSDSIGVVWVGTKEMTDKQRQAMYSLLRGLIQKYGIDVPDIYGHNQFNEGKACPVIDMNFIRFQTLFTIGGMNVDEI